MPTSPSGVLGSSPLTLTAIAIGSCAALVRADVRLPAVVGDRMVLQQSTRVRLWGWADPGEHVRVRAGWSDTPFETDAGADGRWALKIDTPAAGGPYAITITGKNTVELKDVLIGEVWVCSGQSNMEFALNATDHASEDAAAAKYPKIRLFTVRRATSVRKEENCATDPGGWAECAPAAVPNFSAVAYFFARDIHTATGLPIGVIHTSWGGTLAEAWTSEEGLREFPQFNAAIKQLGSIEPDPNVRAAAFRKSTDDWWKGADAHPSTPAHWNEPAFDDSTWKTLNVPGVWAVDGLDQFDGFVYLRRTFDVPAGAETLPSHLELGPIDDMDDAFVNGVSVGSTRAEGMWNTARSYPIPAGVLKPGRNVAAVRVLDTGGLGGVTGTPDLDRVRWDAPGHAPAPLAGMWKYRGGPAMAALPPMPVAPAMNPNTPTVLYNAMIAPITPYTIRGAIWYQGESNRNDPEGYRTLFPAMIKNWRTAWAIGDFPFYFTQIAPFAYGNDRGETALVREAQLRTLSVPRTGMAVTTDIGDPRDIHPRNKRDVGHRLALWALAKDYGQAGLEHSGPLFKAAAVEGASIRVSFDHATGGLVARGGDLTHFSVAGEDRIFHIASARIDGTSVVVSCDRVPKPVAVRFGWDAACEPNLFNNAGLPASPFRTDEWARPPEGWGPAADAGKTEFLAEGEHVRSLLTTPDLPGWVNVNTAPGTWTLRDGVLACSGEPWGMLRTDRQYENFEIDVEWRALFPGSSSGVYVWCDALPATGVPFCRGIQAQISAGLESDWYTSHGDLFGVHGAALTPENEHGPGRALPIERRARAAPYWNHYRLRCEDGNVALSVNGKVVTRGKFAVPRKGYIALESEGTAVEFRNIRVRELPSSSTALRDGDTAALDVGFRCISMGQDLSQWAFGAAHQFAVRPTGRSLQFQACPEVLRTRKSFRDLILTVDWRWEMSAEARALAQGAGNQTAATAGPNPNPRAETGEAAVVLRGSDGAPTETEVRITQRATGCGDVIRRAIDGAPGERSREVVAPAETADIHRGEWNRFQITVRGDRVSVVLNDRAVVNDAEIDGMHENGPIGLRVDAGEIEFANVFVKELK